MGSSIPMGVDRSLAASKVGPPAIALMITSGLGIALHLLYAVLALIGAGTAGLAQYAPKGNIPPEAERIQAMLGGGIGLVVALLFIAMHALAFLGALRMRALRSYGLALAGAIVSLIACSPSCCCCIPLSLPFAIWAIVVLVDPNVKASFES
jgi:hypothetical protein